MEKLKTIKISNKEYVLVNERVKAFRQMYPNGSIRTELVSNENGVCVFKAKIYSEAKVIIDKNGFEKYEVLVSTGYAYEKENSTFINKTSYIENCETSAVGRALGFLGIGIDTAICSAEEVQNAIIQEIHDETGIIDRTHPEFQQAYQEKIRQAMQSIETNAGRVSAFTFT